MTPEETKLAQSMISRMKVDVKHPWYILIKKYRRTYKKELLDQLENYIDERDDNDYYKLKGINVICAHLYKLFHNEPSESLVSTYAAELLVDESYYCRICGEMIAKKEYDPQISWEGDKESGRQNIDNGTVEFIRRYVIGIMKNDLEFKVAPTDGHFNKSVNKIAWFLVPKIKDVDKQLFADKINNSTTKENKRKLFTIIYIYAIMIKLVIDNPNDIKFKFSPGYAERIKTAQLLPIVSKTIISRQNILINNIDAFSHTNIPGFLSSAFDELAVISTKIKQFTKNAIDFSSDNIYEYIREAIKIYFPKLTYEPDFSQSFCYQGLGKFIIDNGERYDYVPQSLDFSDVLRASFGIFVHYLEIPHDTPPFTETITNFSSHYAKYLDYFNAFMKIERAYFAKISRENWVNFGTYPRFDNLFKQHIDKKCITMDFGMKTGFHKHVWKIKNGALTCNICEDTFDNVAAQYSENLVAYVQRYYTVLNFYNFYFNQCLNPGKSIFHIWNNGECEQCHITKKMIIENDLEFFEKNHDKFDKAHEHKVIVLATKEPKPIQIAEPCEYKQMLNSLSNFMDRTSFFVTNQKFQINIEKSIITKIEEYKIFWENIGNFEANIFESVLAKKKVNVNLIMRKQYLTFYIEFAMKHYYALKNYKNLVVVDDDLRTIMNEYNIILTSFKAPINKNCGVTLEEQVHYLYDYLLELIVEIIQNVQNEYYNYYFINLFIKNEKSISQLSERERLMARGMMQDSIFNDEVDDTTVDDVYEDMDYEGQNEEYNT
jgi:hypothetical protein